MIEETSLTQMEDIKNIDDFTINQFINCLRNFFLKRAFVEVSLFNTTKYLVKNTYPIKTSTGEFLRNTTEPEIWEKGINYDNFFCITSLFRNEDTNSLLHKNEFKIVDFYSKNTNENEMLSIFFDALDYLESELILPKLSKLKINTCDFEEFKSSIAADFGNSIYKVENYPVEECFYDTIDELTGKSKKGELFFIDNGKAIEFSVFGQVDENRNPNNVIENFNFKKSNIKSLDLFGMCLGIERTILCYNILKQELL